MAENKPGLSGTPVELRGVGDHTPQKNTRPVFGETQAMSKPKSKPHTKSHSVKSNATTIAESSHARPVFGEFTPRKSGYSPTRATIESTMSPSGLVPQAQQEIPPKRKPLGVGDPLHLENPNILNFEEVDRGGKYREAGFVTPGDYTITAIHTFEGRGKPVFSLERQLEDGHISRINIRPIGNGHGWERVEKDNNNG